MDAWAKLRRDDSGDVVAWHPLLDHCLDVAAVCSALLDNPVLRSRLARLGDQADLDLAQRHRLAILAGLHDIGKANHGFHNRWNANARPHAGHVGEVLAVINRPEHPLARSLAEVLRVEKMLTWCIGPEGLVQLLLASFWHHGRPVEIEPHRFSDELWHEADGYDPLVVIEAIVDRLWDTYPETQSGASLPDTPTFGHAFMGLVTLADWLGSDTRFFALSSGREPERAAFAKHKAIESIAQVGADARIFRQRLPSGVPDFETFFDGKVPRPAQRAMVEQPLPQGASTLILEAETGSGKTEAALYWFLRLFGAGLVDGLYFALPTRAAAQQIYERVNRAIQRIFGQDAPPVVLAVPGYIKVDEVSGRLLPDFGVFWPEDEVERLRYRGWAGERPKRYMAATIVVGTIDQVLLSTLKVAHSHMRATALLRHLIVVDEVHASDAYMSSVLVEALRFHMAAGGHALLMSATLGSRARGRLLALGRAADLAFDEAACLPYPTIVLRDANGTRTTDFPHCDYTRSIQRDTRPLAGDVSELVRQAFNKARRGARVLVLRNTVRAAVETQAALEDAAGHDAPELFRCREVPAPHHGRFAAEDRKTLDQSLLDTFGRDSLTRGCIVVTTQTVEQSLDIDFDILFTDLCPMDVLLQRAGRLHRWPDRSPVPGFEVPRLVVIVPAERDLSRYIHQNGQAYGPHGLGTVYDDLCTIELTWRSLEARPALEIPAMNRRLVEEATHPGVVDNLVREAGEPWGKHRETVWGSRAAESQIGRLGCVERDKNLNEMRPFGELNENIRTRLGEDDRLVTFANTLTTPFRNEIRGLTIPGHLTRGISPTAVPEKVCGNENGFDFLFGGKRFRYNRYGLEQVNA
ncbi:MAG: CRISPR-associated helicase Cas3' [Dehalococcoidia bacterium]|nr:CRISPR-associated helicase Cas3' [Dehalococcoidia bacterium]